MIYREYDVTPAGGSVRDVSAPQLAGGLGKVDSFGTPLDQGVNPLTGISEGPSGEAPFMPSTGPIPDNIIVDRPPEPGEGPAQNVPANPVIDTPQATDTSPTAQTAPPWEDPPQQFTTPTTQRW